MTIDGGVKIAITFRRVGVARFCLLAVFLAAGAARVGGQTETSTPNTQETGNQPRVEQAKGSASRSLRGRVTESGRPVADASISFLPANFTTNRQSAVASMFRGVTSDADGRFELPDLTSGAYHVMAWAPGYVLSDADADRLYRPGDNVALALMKGGVITGKVTTSSGDAVVGARMRALRIKNSENRVVRKSDSSLTNSMELSMGEWVTDDRGIYRIYGLAPGIYQVSAGGRGALSFSAGAYDADAPTYYPSNTPDTATEITVRAGEEVAGIDIRYRDLRGHAISGVVVMPSKSTAQLTGSVLLARASGGGVEATAVIPPGTDRSFAFDAVSDGEYLISVVSGAGFLQEGSDLMSSMPRRVSVKGADVTGLQLALEPLGSITGRVTIESAVDATRSQCKDAHLPKVDQFVVTSPSDDPNNLETTENPLLSAFQNTTPDDKGEFSIRFVAPGKHHLDVSLPGEALFVRTMTLTPSTPNARPVDIARTGLTTKAGEQLKGLVVTVAEGAAGIRGRVVLGGEARPAAARMRVHLVPAEKDSADEVLRYAEADTELNGSFSLGHIAPGKYWLVAREISDQEPADYHKPLAWDGAGRAGLRFEGEASKQLLELSACQRAADIMVRYTPLIAPAKPVPRKQ
jgi:carboxypeptidase family protein